MGVRFVAWVRVVTAVMRGRRFGCLMRVAATLRGLVRGCRGAIWICILCIALRLLPTGRGHVRIE